MCDFLKKAALLSHLLTILLAAPVCTILLILFGGPLTTHLLHNILCASHMSLLAVLPLFYVYGVDAEVWNEIISAILPFDEVWGGTVGTVLGAWFGAVPIPLDWYVENLLFFLLLTSSSTAERAENSFRESRPFSCAEWEAYGRARQQWISACFVTLRSLES